MRGLAVAAALLGACAADDDQVAASRHAASAPTTVDATACAGLRDHIASLRVSAEALGLDPATLPPADLEQLRRGAASALGPDFVSRCERSTTSAELACSLAASSLSAAAACKGAS